jgi:alcohol dehydrogenase class IV
MLFEFATATRILFGPGVVKEVAPAAKDFGQRVLIVAGRSTGQDAALNRQLGEHGFGRWTIASSGEPTIDDVEAGAELARTELIDLVVSLGGGSVIDLGKAIAAIATNEGHIEGYLEVIGDGRPLTNAPLPFIAIPTTAGTGAEVTRNAVLASPEHRVKVSLRSPLMLPRLAVVDPELTLGLPTALTASTGLDALTQLIEPFVSCRANPLTSALCRDGIQRVAHSLRRACREPANLAAREDMALASLFSGLALANAGLGAVHGFAAPIGGMFPAPHGAVCAALLPHAVAVNVRALRERKPESQTLPRYEEVARLLTGNAAATAEDGMAWVRELGATLGIPPLRTYGIREADVPMLCEKAAVASSMKGNPLPLRDEELREILSRAL